MEPFAFLNLISNKVKHLTPYLPGRSIQEIQKQYHIDDVIKLASNENPRGCSPKVIKKLQTIKSSDLSIYPATTQHPLLPALCEFLEIRQEQILITNGSDAGFSLLLQAFACPYQKKILTHQYAFMGYEIQASSFGIDTLKSSIHPKNWTIDVPDLKRLILQKPALIFLANPNNPTGQKLSWDDIETILQTMDPETLLVLDEAYYEYDPFPHPSIPSLLETYPNLIITRTFSKAYGLAALRIGYLMAHPEIIQILKRIQLPFTINQLALDAAHIALQDQTFIEQTKIHNQQGQTYLLETLKSLPLIIRPSWGNFITLEHENPIQPLVQFLESQGIIIRGLQAFGLEKVARMTIGTPIQNQKLSETLHHYFQ